MFKKFLKSIEFNFQNLSKSKPSGYNSKLFNFDLITDDTVKNFDSKKYVFYQQFINQIAENPEDFKKVLYEYNLIKVDREKVNKIIDDIVKQYKKISAITDVDILKNEELYKIKKANIEKKEGKIVENFITQLKEAYGIKNEDNNDLKLFVGGNDEEILKVQNRLEKEKNQYIENIHNMKKDYEKNKILNKYIDRLDTAINNDNLSSDYEKAERAKDVLDDIEDEDNIYSIQQIEISKEDKLVFIGITFLIRILCLSLVDWALKTNFIVSFTEAYLLYVFMYSIFILLILVIVNISYNMPLADVYNSDSSILSKLGSTLYYFYLIPGNRLSSAGRIIFHLGLLYFITIVSIIIKQTNGQRDSTNEESKIRYDYSFKRDIRNTLNTFTLMSWIFLSMLAIM